MRDDYDNCGPLFLKKILPEITQLNLHNFFINLPSTSQILRTQANVKYASSYAIDEKWFVVFLRLHTLAFERAAVMALLKGLGDKVNHAMTLQKEIFIFN
jgi:hypothetical protein